MTAPHPRPTLRPAERRDAEAILALEETGMRGYAEALWATWRPSATPETLDLAGHEMILSEGATVGCIACHAHSDHLEVRKLYLAANARGRGFGADVLALKIETASQPIRLRTLVTNSGAIRFYLREGFEVVSTDAERVYLAYHKVIPPAST